MDGALLCTAQSHERTKRRSRPRSHSGLCIQLLLVALDPTKPSEDCRCLEGHAGRRSQTSTQLLFVHLHCSLGSFFVIPPTRFAYSPVSNSKLSLAPPLHCVDCNLARCPYGKTLRSNAAVVTLWPVLRGRNPSLQQLVRQYDFPWSSIYFRFLYNSFTVSLCLTYLDIIKATRASKIHCQEQSYLLTDLQFACTCC